jgi:hypothetical protein
MKGRHRAMKKMNGNLIAVLASGVIISAIYGIVVCIKTLFNEENFE